MFRFIKQKVKKYRSYPILLLALVLLLFLFCMVINSFVVQYNRLDADREKQVQALELENGVIMLNLLVREAEFAENNCGKRDAEALIQNLESGFLGVKQLKSKSRYLLNSPLFLKSDSLIQQRISFYLNVKGFYEKGNVDSAAGLISTYRGAHLTDSIINVNIQSNAFIRENLKKLGTELIVENNKLSSLAYKGITIAAVSLALIIGLLSKEGRRRRKIVTSLRRQKEKYRITLDSLAEGLITVNREGRIIYMNPSAEKLTGWSWHEARRQPLEKVFNVVNEETGSVFENIVARILSNGKAIELENNTILKARNECELVISNSGVPLFDTNQKVAGVVLTFNDITLRKQAEQTIKASEEKYRNLIENASDAIFVYSLDGQVSEYNKRCYTLLGYTKDEFSRLNVDDIFAEDIITGDDIAVLNGETRTLYRHLKHRNGSLLKTEVTVKLLSDRRAIAFARDLTERWKMQQALLHEQYLMQTLMNYSPDQIYFKDSKSRFLRISKSQADRFGLADPAEAIGKTDLDFFSEEHALEAYKDEIAIIETGKMLSKEEKETWPDGATTYVLTSKMPLRDKEGNIIGTFGISRDISDRKKAEAVLFETQNRLRTIVEAEPECVKLLDKNGLLTEMNPAGLAMIEADSLMQVKGKNVLDIICTPYRKPYLRLIEGVFEGRSEQLEFEIIGLKGTHRWLETQAVPLKNADGKIISLLGLTRDITERKKTELEIRKAIERYNILSKATSDTIWDWDIANNRILYNDGISTMFGYDISKVKDVVEWWNEKIHPDDFQKVNDTLEWVFAKCPQRFQLNYRFRCIDGSYKYIYDRAFVIYDVENIPVRMIGAMQDITPAKVEEERIAKAIIDAQEQERSQLGAELHDNINQILAGTLLTLGMAKSKNVRTKQRIGFISSAMNYITHAINEARKLSHELSPVGFADSSLKELFLRLLSNINIDGRFCITTHFDDLHESEIPENIQLNFYRILQEQTKNILKYAEASSIEVQVTLRENVARLRIFDNGKGFDTRVKKDGIGLSNIKKRAESLGGKLVLKSAVGKGCEVIAIIPVQDKAPF